MEHLSTGVLSFCSLPWQRQASKSVMIDHFTAESAAPPDQGPIAVRAARLKDVVAALREMGADAEDAGDHGRATSLRLMQRHFEGELAQTEDSLAAVARAAAHVKDAGRGAP